MAKRLKLGMIGGGQGAFIGAVHRLCARMDDKYEFVAGCLSSTPEKAAKSAEEIGLDPSRSYPDFKTMAEEESKRDDGIDVVSIVTPNHMHAAPAIEFLNKNGIDTDEFIEKYDSYGTEARVKKSSNLARRYQIDSVPTIIVNGKYLTSGSYVSSYEELYSVVNFLVERERND